jgi:POT family proton-dependent oligopeptide transporter
VQAASTWIIVAISAAYFLYLLLFAGLAATERKRVILMLALFLACALFWSGFEQAGSSFNLFAERHTDRQFGTFTVPAGWFQSLNPIFIVVLAPLFSSLWVWLGARNLDPASSTKFMFGLVGMACGFLIMSGGAALVAGGSQASAGWLVSVYLVHTLGELCLSPVGLSAFTKLAPARFVGQSLGIWFMGSALGNLIAGRIAGEFDADNLAAMPGQLMHIFWFGLASAAALLIAGPVINRWIGSTRHD